MVGVAMEDQVGAVAVSDFGEAGVPEVREYLCRFTFDGIPNWGIVNHYDALLGA
jgi:hypothetical protein